MNRQVKTLAPLSPMPTATPGAILERVTDAVLVMDLHGNLTYCNPAATRVFQYPVEHLLGMPARALFPEPAGADFVRRCQQAMASGDMVEFETCSCATDCRLRMRVYPAEDGLTAFCMQIARQTPAEDDLQDDQRYRTLFAEMTEGFALHEIICDEHGTPIDYRFLDINPAFERLTGLHRDALIGQRVSEVLPGIEQYWIETYGDVALTGKPVHFDNYSAVLDRYYEVFAYRSAPRQFAVIFTDITERKEMEKALQTANRRLEILSDTAGELLASHDPQQVVNNLCRRVMPALDCDVFFNFLVHDEEKGILHLNACGGIPEETARQIEWLEYGVAVCGCVAREGHRIIAEDIQHVPDVRTELVKSFGVQAYCCHPLLVQERVIGTLSFGTRSRAHFTPEEVAVMKAVADLVATGMERIRTENALRKRESLLQQIIEIMPVGVWMIDEKGHISHGNPAGRQIWAGARLGGIEQYGEYQAWRADTGESIPAEEWAGLRAYREGLTTVNEELVISCFDGTQKTILNSAVPIRNEQGEMSGVVVVNQDITALKDLDHAKDEFLAVLSHELQTPLTSMLGWTEVAQIRDNLDSYRQSLPIIQRNARRQQRLVNELLDMSKLLHRRLDYQPEPTELCKLAITTVEGMVPAAERGGLTLTLLPVAEDLPILADPERIRQCIEHLLINSIKFSSPGGTISVTCCREGDQAVLTVHDTGRGIAPEQLASLFKPFRQVERDEAAGGLGLGLAIARGITELHGGTVTADSAGPGQGSTFTITLPLLRE